MNTVPKHKVANHTPDVLSTSNFDNEETQLLSQLAPTQDEWNWLLESTFNLSKTIATAMISISCMPASFTCCGIPIVSPSQPEI